MAPPWAPGSVVAWWDGNTLALGAVAGEDKQRVRIVRAEGGEERLLPARVAFEVEPPGPDAPARAARAAARAAAAAAEVDVAVLWEVAVETDREPSLEDLARLALGASGGPALAALGIALAGDGAHFVRRGDAWEVRPQEAVREILRQREREAERAAERAAFLDGLREAARGGPWVAPADETTRRRLRILEDVAVQDARAAPAATAAALEILDAIPWPGERAAERAFSLLRCLGVFASDDENLWIRRHGLREEFPAEALAAAQAAAASDGWRDGRQDLTGLRLVTIDSPWTREIDDALSVEPGPGETVRLGIHVADPGAFVSAGDPVDLEARARGTSHYLPDRRLPMLPASISEGAASLLEGEERPALSFVVDLLPDGAIGAFRVVAARVRVAARLSYDEADRILESPMAPWAATLDLLRVACEARERWRAARGAVLLRAPEVDVRLADGAIRLERIDPWSPSRRLVSEAMVLAGEVAARFCLESGIPAIYRRQAAPAAPVRVPPGSESDPAVVRAVRRGLRRGEGSVQPGPHHALGLDAYAQATSPLRRYQDLAVHRQIRAVLGGGRPPHAVDELRAIAAATERAESEAREAERSADLYWRLRYLEAWVGRNVDAVVVEAQPPVVQLAETLIEERVRGIAAARPGDRLAVRVERVVPRAELLVLRAALEGPDGA